MGVENTKRLRPCIRHFSSALRKVSQPHQVLHRFSTKNDQHRDSKISNWKTNINNELCYCRTMYCNEGESYSPTEGLRRFFRTFLIMHSCCHSLLQRRWKIVRLFAWLQNFRRLIVRYEYHLQIFQAMDQLGCAAILLR